MKRDGLLSIKELAQVLSVSTDTVRRAARRGQIPSTRERTAYRFDWPTVRRALRANAHKSISKKNDAPAQRAAPAGRAQATTPPIGNTGALATRLVTGGLSVR
ncbi:MAG TPA: helix-turn-helix domain-containing protein [Nitrospira sp.]